MDNQMRQEAEAKLKITLRNITHRLSVPAIPAPAALPASLLSASEEQKELWQLRADLNALRKYHQIVARYIGRGLVALISIAASWLGWGFVSQIFKILGF